MRRFTLSRRDIVCGAGALGLAGWMSRDDVVDTAAAAVTATPLPDEPLEIEREPQFVCDLHVVDCTWALHEKREPVQRVFHPCQKHSGNPLLTGDDPSHLWVIRDQPDGPFRMYYQLNDRVKFNRPRQPGEAAFRRVLGYAESNDGVQWTRPNLDLFKDQGGDKLPRNTLLFRPDAPLASMGDTPQIVNVPERDRRGYRYHLLYLGTGPERGSRGIRLIGSKDGVHWDLASDTRLTAISSDHHNTVICTPSWPGAATESTLSVCRCARS